MAAPTDPYALLHYNMVHGTELNLHVLSSGVSNSRLLIAHQTYKRGYDIILSHLKNPPSNDLQNFLGYCEAWAVSIEGHHDSEVIRSSSPFRTFTNARHISGANCIPILERKDGFLWRDRTTQSYSRNP